MSNTHSYFAAHTLKHVIIHSVMWKLDTIILH